MAIEGCMWLIMLQMDIYVATGGYNGYWRLWMATGIPHRWIGLMLI